MAYSLYLIRNTRDTDLYYAEHGEIGGVPDAVGYDEPLHAMKFRTYEEAQAYIDTSSRSGQETAIVRRSLPPRILPGSAVELRLCSAAASRSRALGRLGQPIPDRLLAPTPGRLRLWRC